MESNVEIILMGNVDKLIDSFDDSTHHNCINIYPNKDGLMCISHNYNELMYFMKSEDEFGDREYVLKELTEEEENRYLALFNITDEETLASIIYEELKNLPTTKYPREE